MKHKTQSADWPAIIDQIEAAGVSRADIGAAMDVYLTDRMVVHYRRGSVEPAWFRGIGLIALWCRIMGKAEQDVPMRDVVRGHRAARTVYGGPKVQSLPQWPPSAPVSAKPVKRRRGK